MSISEQNHRYALELSVALPVSAHERRSLRIPGSWHGDDLDQPVQPASPIGTEIFGLVSQTVAQIPT